MKTKRTDRERLRKLLTDAHMAKERLVIAEHWQQRVLAHVSELGPVTGEKPFVDLFEQVVWRLVPFTLAISVGIVVLLARLHYTTEYNGMQLFVHYAEEAALKGFLGI